MSSKKYHCTRCNGKLEKSNVDSNNERLVFYCYKPLHKPIRFHIFVGAARHTIRKERLTENKEIDPKYNLRKLFCICGRKLSPERVGVNHKTGITKGNCYPMEHRVELTITSKLYPHEPSFYELQEISFRPIPKVAVGQA